MKLIPEISENRREFLRSGLRTLLFGGIAIISGLLGWREIRAAGDGRLCAITSSCIGCTKFNGCTDPKAKNLKQNIYSK